MKKYYLILAALCFVIPAVAQETITIKHLNGETTVTKNPKRLVVLDMGSLENCHELNIPVIGGLGNVAQYMPKYGDANTYTAVGTVPKADVAAVAQLKPDLIITSTRQRSQIDSLSAIAPTLVLGTTVADFWSTFENNVQLIGSIFNKEKEAAQKLGKLRQKLAQVQAKAEEDQNKAVVVMHINERLIPNGPNSRFGFAHDMLHLKPAYISEASAENQGERGKSNDTPSLETLNPDYLFVFDRATGIQGTMPVLADLLTDDAKKTKAYKNGKVFLLPGFIWYLSGSGLLSVDNKVTDIGEKLYGIKF
ncbi:siderophore ABC transporter substrate-binding protein [Sphingobacterium sp. Mn56C]|uniref:siderophore ABC transporter substrate-binding protein n=1 Tax=Sphingobacterium sp. Mn56C TaxID=3395261 RepID=UPI003BE0E635